MQQYEMAWAYVAALTGQDPASVVMDWRALHDVDRAASGRLLRATLPDAWSWIVEHNNAGYGIFCTINAMDGAVKDNGQPAVDLTNVAHIRAHAVDLDNLSAMQNYQIATVWQPSPTFAVMSSPGKAHVYWSVEPYTGNDYFTLIQRKLRQTFDGDPTIVDASRVLRVPGTLHQKNPASPHLVTCHALAGYGARLPVATLDAALAHVSVIDGGAGQRVELGDPDLAGPSLDWCKYAMSLVDPNTMGRADWIAFTAGIKQAMWSHTDPETAFTIWSEWCARYDTVGSDGKPLRNDPGENRKQWNDVKRTQLGWKSIVSRVPALKAALALDSKDKSHLVPVTTPPPLDCSGAMLTDAEQRVYFAGVTYVVNLGTMLTPDNRFLNTGQFNALFGGKAFVWTQDGKTTDEPWKAATRSTLWTVPKVDHIRFLPTQSYAAVIMDDMGRKGINTYRPAVVRRVTGDAAPFLNHIGAMLPDVADQRVLLDYLAHNVQYPGKKIPWAPVIQSVEGAGKGVLKRIIRHCIGASYTYFPNAKDLSDSGAKFNAWMRNKLFILADEIKVDDRRDMIEVLKPMISEETIEIQGKGENQDIEDNFANWLFFSNWKDAIPVNKNGRRFAIMYSALQTVADLTARGMDDTYFKALYDWLDADGCAIVYDYLMRYPIERGAIPMRAPITSSMAEALTLTRGPVERLIAEAVEDALPGFAGGWVSVQAVTKRMKDTGARACAVATIETALGSMGYVAKGRAPKVYAQSGDMLVKPHLYHVTGTVAVEDFGRAQGWE